MPSLSLYSADIAFQRYDMLHGVFRKQKTVAANRENGSPARSKLSRSRHSSLLAAPGHRVLANA